MILFVVLLQVQAMPAEVDLVILSKHRPRSILVASGCAAEKLPVVRITATAGGVQACSKQKNCVVKEKVDLRCRRNTTLNAPNLAARRYGRSFTIRSEEGVLRVVARVDLESYVAGVVEGEHRHAPQKAKRALAIVVRTYALNALSQKRHRDASLCDLTHCQVFAGLAKNNRIASATRGQVLVTDAGERSPVFFHSTCGGQTVRADRVWPAIRAPELIAVQDADAGRIWCRNSPHFRWIFEVDEIDLARVLSSHRTLDAPSLQLKPDGADFQLVDRMGVERVSGSSLHTRLGRAFGWGKVKSSRFEVVRAGHTFRLRGQGMGHGVGLCQYGAAARAKAGHSAEQILEAYFPRLKVRR